MDIGDTLLRISDAYGLPEPTSPKDRDYWDMKMAALIEYLGVTVHEPGGRTQSRERRSPLGGYYPSSGYSSGQFPVADMNTNVGPDGALLSSKLPLARIYHAMRDNVHEDGSPVFIRGGMGDKVNSRGMPMD